MDQIILLLCVAFAHRTTAGDSGSIVDINHAVLTELLNRNNELETNMTRLQTSYDELKHQFELLEEIVHKHLLVEMNSLKDQVKSIGTKTYLLDLRDNTRNRDINNLYNKSLESERAISQLTNTMDIRFQDNEQRQNSTSENILAKLNKFYSDSIKNYINILQNITSLETNNVTEKVAALSKQIKEYKLHDEISHNALLQRVSEASLKVGMTACVSVDGIVRKGQSIKFDQFRSHVGILDLTPVRSNGEFLCEKAGLYHISVVINTPTPNARFSIHVNGNIMSTQVISSDHQADTGTSVVAVELDVGDRIWAETDTDIHVYFHWSCMTIVKI